MITESAIISQEHRQTAAGVQWYFSLPRDAPLSTKGQDPSPHTVTSISLDHRTEL